jgi:hypothetical protein
MLTDWRRWGVLLVLVAGFVAMVATSQPRWSQADEVSLSFAAGEPEGSLLLVADEANLEASGALDCSVNFEVLSHAEGVVWTVEVEGVEDSARTLTVEARGDGGAYGRARWEGELLCGAAGACQRGLRLRRSGEALPEIKVLVSVYIGAIGESEPPSSRPLALTAP